MKIIEGLWLENDLRRAFVAGAKWWEYHKTGFTMWQYDQRLAEIEACRRYQVNETAEILGEIKNRY